MATFDHAPTVLFKPHALATLEAIELATCFLLLFILSRPLQFPLRFFECLHSPRGLVLLFSSRLKVALGILMDGRVKFKQNLGSFRLKFLIGKQGCHRPISRRYTDDPRDGFDGPFDGIPSVSINRFLRLIQQSFNVIPVFLNEMPKTLLFLDFFRKSCQRLFLLRLPSLQAFNFGGLPSSRTRLFEPFLLSALQSMCIV